MRIQVYLLFQIRLADYAHIMVQERHRHDQRQELVAVAVENFQHPLLLVSAELGLEIAEDVLKHVQGEDLLDKGLPQFRIVQPPLFLDRQQGKVPGEGPGEQTPFFSGMPFGL